MTPADLPRVNGIAGIVHPSFPEDAAIFAERLRLYPAGCHVLAAPDGTLSGYIISHPWRYREPPALDALIGVLPGRPTTFYIHDLALLPDARGMKAARTIVMRLLDHARQAGLPKVSLIAVNDSQRFWQRLGFIAVESTGLDDRLASYGDAASFMALDILGK